MREVNFGFRPSDDLLILSWQEDFVRYRFNNDDVRFAWTPPLAGTLQRWHLRYDFLGHQTSLWVDGEHIFEIPSQLIRPDVIHWRPGVDGPGGEDRAWLDDWLMIAY